MGKPVICEKKTAKKKKKTSFGSKIERLMLSWAYRRNRNKYLKSFKISDKYESDNKSVEGSSTELSSTLRPVYDVETYPLQIGEYNCEVFKKLNKLTINKSTFVVKENSCGDDDDGKNYMDNPLIRKTMSSLFDRYNELLSTVKRSIEFEDCYSIKEFISRLLSFRFQCILPLCSTVLCSETEECVLKIVFGRQTVSNDDDERNMTLPAGLIHKMIRTDPVIEICFYDQRSLPEQEQDLMVKKKNIRIDDLYCFIYLRTQPLFTSPIYGK